jgi:hypothetical protein
MECGKVIKQMCNFKDERGKNVGEKKENGAHKFYINYLHKANI